MNVAEKMEVMEQAVAYARGAYNCLDCVGPGGWNYATDNLNCRGGTRSDVARINDALRSVGLTPEEVDTATAAAGIVEHGGPLGLAEGWINGCTDVDDFLKVVRGLLEGK